MEEAALLAQSTQTFAQVVCAHIVRLKCGCNEFCDRTLLSDKTYERLKNNDMANPSRVTVMQICVGLALGERLGEQLFHLAGYHLTPQWLAYRNVLQYCQGRSIHECDEVLQKLNAPSILPKQYRTQA